MQKMSHWDGEKVISWPAERCEQYPAWIKEDCGCCAGIQWGGEFPRECDECAGNGFIYRHESTGTLAQYPGGPLLGKATLDNSADTKDTDSRTTSTTITNR